MERLTKACKEILASNGLNLIAKMFKSKNQLLPSKTEDLIVIVQLQQNLHLIWKNYHRPKSLDSTVSEYTIKFQLAKNVLRK